MKRAVVSQWVPYQPPAASVIATAAPIIAVLRVIRDARVLAAAGSLAVGGSERRASGNSAIGGLALSSLLALARDSDVTSKAWAPRRGAMGPRAPAGRSELGETS